MSWSRSASNVCQQRYGPDRRGGPRCKLAPNTSSPLPSLSGTSRRAPVAGRCRPLPSRPLVLSRATTPWVAIHLCTDPGTGLRQTTPIGQRWWQGTRRAGRCLGRSNMVNRKLESCFPTLRHTLDGLSTIRSLASSKPTTAAKHRWRLSAGDHAI